jgi:hypothetical protein
MRMESLSRGGLDVELYTRLDADRERVEREIRDAGLPIPFPHRFAWARTRSDADSWLLLAREPDGTPGCALGLELLQSRSLPGHRLLRSVHFGGSRSDAARAAALGALVELARRKPRILRVYLELFSRDEQLLESLAAEASSLGFQRSLQPRCYDSTVLLELSPSETELLASFHGTARRHIRAVDKNPVEVRAIEDVALAGRLDALLEETMSRTGGHPEPHDWDAIIRLSRSEPAASRLVGLFRTDRPGPESLLAFAWGQNHGDVVEYATAASTRDTDLKLPMVYALAWDLIRWAKESGATHFDFGGISAGTHGDGGDRLGGISDFKRYFTEQAARVGDEWIFEPAPVRAALARAVSAGNSWMRRVRS